MPYLPSLFNDQELLNQFAKIAQAPARQPQATTPASTTVDPNAIKTIAIKMVDNLSKDVSINAEKTTPPLYMKDLQSLDQFIMFLQNGQIKYNGEFIVQTLTDNKMDPEQSSQSRYLPYKWQAGGSAHFAPAVAIYKDGLIAYLTSLQQKATNDSQGHLLTVLIGRLIAEANTTLQTNINHEALKGTGAPTTQPAGESGSGANKPVSYQKTDENSGKLSPAGVKAAMTIIDNGPFLGDRIDLPHIRNFLTSYARLGPQVNIDPATIANIQNAQQILNTITTTYNVARQSLSQDANGLASTITTSTHGNAAAPRAFLTQLKDLINTVAGILTDFKGDVYASLPEKQWQDALDEQIGAGGSSFYNINIDKIDMWLNDLPQNRGA